MDRSCLYESTRCVIIKILINYSQERVLRHCESYDCVYVMLSHLKKNHICLQLRIFFHKRVVGNRYGPY